MADAVDLEVVHRWLRPHPRTLDPSWLPRLFDLVPVDEDPDVLVPEQPPHMETIAPAAWQALDRLLGPLTTTARIAAGFVALDQLQPTLAEVEFHPFFAPVRTLAAVLAAWRERDEWPDDDFTDPLLAVARLDYETRFQRLLISAHYQLGVALRLGRYVQPADPAALDPVGDQPATTLVPVRNAVTHVMDLLADQWCPEHTSRALFGGDLMVWDPSPRPRFAALRREITRWWRLVQARVAVRDVLDPRSDDRRAAQ